MAKRTEAVLKLVSNDNGKVIISTAGTKAAPGSKISYYHIIWDDGYEENKSGKPPSTLTHEYEKSGSYDIHLTVGDNRGRSDTESMGMIVSTTATPPVPPITGTLDLSSTFNSISVKRDFVGSQTVGLEYKNSSSLTWLSADTPIYDSRVTINGNSNPYIFQYRGSIVGLTPGTSYDVRMTIGSSVYQSSISTLASSVTNGGTTRTVTPANIAAALAIAVPGDIIDMTDGTYSAFSFGTSGTENAWISFIGRNRDACFIDAGDPADLTINANYIQLKNIRFKKPLLNAGSGTACIKIGVNSHHIWMDNVYCEDIQLPTTVNNYGNTSISPGSGCHHIYLLNSILLCPSLASKSDGDFNTGGFGFNTGVQGAEGTFIISGNIFTGKFQDAIGSDENFGGNQWNNSDIFNNEITGFVDEGIQCEGDVTNLRIYGNKVTDTNGNDCIGQGAGYIGPTYILRNLLIKTGGIASQVFKFGGNQFARVYHNTVDNQVSTADVITGAANTEVGILALNNIFRCTNADMLFRIGAGGVGSEANRFNYNLYYRQINTNIINTWNNNAALNYDDVASFFAAQGQEENGISGSDPNLQGALRTILNTSPAYRVGVVIPNINDVNSAWPFQGVAPDMGYFIVN